MQHLLATRAAHIESAIPGIEAARALSAMTDDAVRDLARAASSRATGRWAIVALGGWGAGALLPDSDLDLLVLSEQPAAVLRPFVEALLYPMWDASLKVGHQVRSPKEQLAAMRGDLATRTAALTGRALAGNLEWANATLAAWARDARKRARRGVAELTARPRPGSPYRLDCQLKDGAGGRRDYDELTWLAATLTGSVCHSPRPLVDIGVLHRDEAANLERAAATLAAVRWRLQRDNHSDRLTAEAANDLGPDGELVHEALGTAALVLERVRARVTKARPRLALGSIPLSARDVFGLLDTCESGLADLELAAQAGLLGELAPSMRALITARRPGLGHELTVGAHCLRTAALVATLEADAPLARSRAAVPDLRTLQVAALAHDVGKLEGGAGHAERGADEAGRIARAFGLSAAQAADVSDLTRLHLALIETALHADLDDEDAILGCAARIGRRELLAPLHVLCAADSSATGPATWTPWTAALVGTLVSRVEAALSEEVDGTGIASHGARVRAQALATIQGSRDAEKAFVEVAPLRYLASRSADEVSRDAALVAELSVAPAAERLRVAVSAGPSPDTRTVTVAAVDRPQLLARLAGSLALAGLSIMSVDAHGTVGRVALDTFVVASATARPMSTETFAAFERFAHRALEDRLELATRLAERQRHYPSHRHVAPSVEIAPGGWDTTVRVVAADRPGLLHDLARAVAETGLDIRWARIQTMDGVARDVFHVVGEDGGPVDEAGVLGHLAMNLRAVL